MANRTAALISKLFKFALDDELIESSPAVRITRPAPEQKRDRVLTDDELRAATFTVPDFRGHDLRRTAASLMAGSGVPRLTVGKILNHLESSVTAVYDRHGYDPEKRVALDQWARMLTGILKGTPAGAVVPFAR